MKERYMIVRIEEKNNNSSMLSESCYQVVDYDYETLDSAYRAKEKYREPRHYIIVQYWQ